MTEIPLKEYLHTLAELEGVQPHAIYMRWRRGTLKLRTRRTSRYFVWVKV